MSLDCYPFGRRQTINLDEQPMAIDVAYQDNLFISVMDQCHTIVIYDLSIENLEEESGRAGNNNNLIREFPLGKDVVIDQLIYSRCGDYLACVGHNSEGILTIYTVFDWRKQSQEKPKILKLNLPDDDSSSSKADDDRSRTHIKLNYIDCCERTGNLAASCGDIVIIYKFMGNQSREEDDSRSLNSQSEIVRGIESCLKNNNDDLDGQPNYYFDHIISVRLTIWALKINLLENYLSITAVDHVQVLKLKLLTLQIQSDGLDAELEALQLMATGNNNNSGSNTINNFNNNQAQSETTSTASTTTCSMISDSNSTTTNFSSFTTNNNTTNDQQINNSDLSIITMNGGVDSADLNGGSNNNDSNNSTDDCITWNLNTKKLVKLPTLMHNTSTNLSSYHICHPLELLGPASESIACRVNASIYSPEFSQNQLEPIVMLCKQFDFDKDPVKSAHLQAVYLSSNDDLKRLNKSAQTTLDQQPESNTYSNFNQDHAGGSNNMNNMNNRETMATKLLKSNDFELLASVTCFVTTLTNCFVYSLHGKKVSRSQTITNPDLCLDLRPDLLNVYLLTPMGLQICSAGICDSTFHYDWSSSADLNLSFISTDRYRILTTKKFIVMIACSGNGKAFVEYIEKPDLISLYDRIVHTVNRCNSISIRSNMLTYLHATAQLALLAQQSCSTTIEDQEEEFRMVNSSKGNVLVNDRETRNILKLATIMLCKQLLQKKQTNVITNSKIDKTIKHLLDISVCDLSELMRRHWQSTCLQEQQDQHNNNQLLVSGEVESDFESSSGDNNNQNFSRRQSANHDGNNRSSSVLRRTSRDSNYVTFGDDDKPLDTDYELIKIYLKYAKFSQSLMDYLIQNSQDELISGKIIDYMFQHNPRILIKCAQRYPLNNNDHLDNLDDDESMHHQNSNDYILGKLVEKLKQLAEYDSTGINRATVLFTLAILYNALGLKQNCLLALEQIKPSNHLAITMCSNFEHSHSIANLVLEHYPDVYNLFLIQLIRKDKQAAQEYSARHGKPKLTSISEEETTTAKNNVKKIVKGKETGNSNNNNIWRKKSKQLRLHPDGSVLDSGDDDDYDYDCFENNGDNMKKENNQENEEEEEEDEHELYEKKLKLLAEIPTGELVELLATISSSSSSNKEEEEDESSSRAYLEASINLLESQFILARLRENSH